MGKLLENATKIASLAALAIYGIVRVGIDAFYGRLGIPAEDVGITQATIVSRAAVSFFIAVILTAMLAAVLTAPMTSWTRRRLEKGRSSGTQPGHSTPVVDTPNLENFSYVVAWLSLFVFGAALLFSTLLDRAEFFPISGPIVTGPVAVLITTAVMLTLTLPALNAYVGMAREDPDRAEARIRSLMWVHGVVATLIGTLVLFSASYFFGDEMAARVDRGQSYAPSFLAGLPWPGSLDVRAECVEIKDKEGTPVSSDIAPERVLYLGQKDSLVLYRPGAGPLRLPTGDFIVSSRGPRDCERS